MYRRTACSFIVGALTAGSLLAISPAYSVPITYRFTVEVTEGSLTGNTFEGMISFDDEAVSGEGKEVLLVEDGLSVTMTMLGETINELQDVDYPQYPQLTLVDGDVERLDFWAESEQRASWWDLPGWEVTVERVEDR
ncbi:MAG: hypothetical protein AAF974_06575 [Cyanobacteria bacterium P01_E01_bin.34]